MAKIQFVISKTGDVKLEVSDMKGIACEEISRAFEENLGTKIKVDYKPEDFCVIEGISQYVHEE